MAFDLILERAIPMKSRLLTVAADRRADLAGALIFISAIILAATRLATTEWVDDLGLVQFLAFLGGLAGLLLGISRFSPRTVFGFALAYSAFAVPWQLGLSMAGEMPWADRLFFLQARLLRTLDQVFRQVDVTDSILFLTAMAVLFWVLSLHGGYTLTRYGNPWAALIPTGAAMFTLHINDRFWPQRAWFLGVYLVLALLLVARMYYLELRAEWHTHRARTPTYVGLDLSRAALIAAVPLILLSWTIPVVARSLPSFEENWQELAMPLRERWDHVFSSLQASVGVIGDYYGDSLSLGRGNELGDALVMTVEAPTVRPSGVRYYWRARVYDYYSSEGWSSTLVNSQAITQNLFDLELSKAQDRWSARMKFTVNIPLRTLHVVPQVYSVDRDGQAIVSFYPDGSTDIGVLYADPYLRPGESYETWSALTDTSVKNLRAAGDDYPQWIRERYLQLPATITPRTRELAQRIVAGLETPYDKVEAVTNFLRENIQYSERIAAPPEDQERVDWLLFDYRQGYCNYYATAQVVLLRSLGIPARVAVGYAQGERITSVDLESVPTTQPGFDERDLQPFEAEISSYLVRQKDAHAWPEVYFPAIGWVEFEPTQNQLPLLRPSGELPQDSGNLPDAEQEPDPANLAENQAAERDQADLLPPLPAVPGPLTPLQIALRVLLAIGSLALIGAALYSLRKRLPPEPIPVQLEAQIRRFGLKPPRFLIRWARLASLPPLTRAYLEINKALARLGQRPQYSATPAERVDRLSRLVPPASEPANYLLSEYHTQTYSPRDASPQQAVESGRQVRRLSYLAWFNRLISRWQEPAPRRAR
jgi:transglutaminase-like putative cysteine protease